MADGGCENDRIELIEPSSSFENTDKTKIDILSNNININTSNNDIPTSKMSRLLRQVKSIFSYLWSQCPGFMLIFYLCYLYFGGFIYIFLSILSILAFLYNFQDSLLYQPNVPPNSRNLVVAPDQFNLPYEDLFLTTRDGLSIHAYFIKQPQPLTAYTMLVLHGNAGNIGHRLYNSQFLYQHCGVNVMLVEYRGYGRSQGSPSEEGLYIDATTALEHLLSRNDTNPNKILIFGRSLGGAVAIGTENSIQYSNQIYLNNSITKLIHATFPAGLILENTFTSIKDMGSDMIKVPFLSYLPDFMVKNKFNSLDKIGQVKTPSLFISGLQDEIVPPPMMQSLYDKSGSRHKKFYQLANGSHNECWRLPGYYKNISHFITEIDQLNLTANQTT